MLKEGDLVTVALRERSNGLLSRTEVTHTTPFPVGKTGFMANDDDRNVHYFVDEGITWVHGHVADDSPEGKALIVAHALAPKFDVFDPGYLMTSSTFFPKGAPNPVRHPNSKNELGE